MDALQSARAAYRAGRLHDALEAAQVAAERRPKDPEAWRLLGTVSRHVGMPAAGDEAFRRAAALGPRAHPVPHRVSREQFAALVERARGTLSRDAARRLEGVAIRMAELPGGDEIAGGLAPESLSARLHAPETLVLFQGNHENRSRDDDELAKLIARTLQRA